MWWWRKHRSRPSPEAVRAKCDSEKGLEEAEALWPPVKEVAASLREIRTNSEEDKFAKHIEDLIRGRL